MKIIITESQLNRIKELEISEEYPVGWDIEVFKTLKSFNSRVKYCNERLVKLGSGSSRIAYKIDDTKVLKLAKNKKGIGQNEIEIEWGNDGYYGDILANIFEYDENGLWVEMELARKVTPTKFMQLIGVPIREFEFYITKKYNEYMGKKLFGWVKIDEKYIETLENSEFVEKIISFSMDSDSLLGDFGRLSSYGVVIRDGKETLVLVDYGLSNDVYNTLYHKMK